MRAVQEREANILRRFKVTPISPMPILVAAMVSGWLLFLPAVFLLVGLAHFLYAMPLPRNWISLFLMATLGVCSIRAIGLILAAVTNTMAGSHHRHPVAVHAHVVSERRHHSRGHAAQVGADSGGVHAGILPGQRFPGHLLPQPEPLGQRGAVAALLVTMVLGMFLAMQLFRWEKEEKIRAAQQTLGGGRAGAVPADGRLRAYSKEHLGNNLALFRDLQRSGTFLIRNTRIFTGDGRVIENGGVLVRDGKIAAVYDGAAPDPENTASRDGGRRGQDAVAGTDRCAHAPGGLGRHIHGARTTTREDHAALRGGTAV